mgnify:CR=1 FL=1
MANFKELKTENITTVAAMMKDFYAIDDYPFDAELTRKNFEHSGDSGHQEPDTSSGRHGSQGDPS